MSTSPPSPLPNSNNPPSDLPTATLPHLTHSTLTPSTLLSACQTRYILLTLPYPTSRSIHAIQRLSHSLFSLPPSTLNAYDIDTISPLKLSGYKPLGRNRAGLASNRDGFETYALPKDGIMKLLPEEEDWVRPDVVDGYYMRALREYCHVIHRVAEHIFQALSSALELETGLETLHRSATVQSPDILRLLRYHPVPSSQRGEGVSHIAHTDLGSLTFLSTTQWGLQIRTEKEGGWEWVEPPKDDRTVIVNVGDMLSMLTGGALKSVVHRVVPVPGREEEERRSFVYLLRAEEAVKMAPIPSSRRDGGEKCAVGGDSGQSEEVKEVLTSGEWLRRKFMMLRGETWERDQSWILSGVKGGEA